MNSDEQDDLWNLLGKASSVAPSPFLARNVLRKIRETEQSKPTIAQWVISRWKLATIFAAALVCLSLNLTLRSSHSREQAEVIQMAATNPDYEVIAHLDDLLASQESSLWTETSPE